MNAKRNIPTMMSRSTAGIVIIGVLYVLVTWRRLLLQPMIPMDGNMIRLFYPAWIVGKKLLTEGFYFLWDPYRNMGQPFLADLQNQALYPLRFLSPFLSYLDYERITVVFHVLLASVPAFLLGKKLVKDDLSALLAGLAMGFNGFFLARVTLPYHFATMAWAPAALLALHSRRPLLLGLVLALQGMAGFPPFIMLTGLALVVFSFLSDHRRETWICFLKGAFLMLGLTAVQWLPFLEMLGQSGRPLLLPSREALEYSLHPLELLRPLFLPSFVLAFLAPVTESDPAIIGFYVGPFLLGLFLWGAWRGGKREKVLAAMTLLAFVLALGRYNMFYRHLPFVTFFRYPAHWLLLSTIGLAFVGASGLKAVGKKRWRYGLLGLLALDLLVATFPRNTAWADLVFFSQAPLRLPGLDRIPEQSRVYHTSRFTNRIHQWKVKTGEDWLFIKGSLVPSVGVAYGIEEAASYEILTSRRHWAFLDRLDKAPLTSPLFDYAGVSRIISLTPEGLSKPMPTGEDVEVHKNKDFKPKAFMDSGRLCKVLEKKPGLVIVEAEGPGKLVLSESFAPGWRVTVDDRDQAVEIFEEAFLSVSLPAGSHRVRFRYLPASFILGLILSLLTALFVVGEGVKSRHATFKKCRMSRLDPFTC
ncbi:MAG: YfhO family protein [Elusimicrobia bacterium]|nr:YfhO family protein [Candidatus Obscuribacterium magneticum]